MSKAGEFELYLSAPYPVFAEIRYQGERIGCIRHTELSDLHYAVTKAMQEARELLRKDAWEVG